VRSAHHQQQTTGLCTLLRRHLPVPSLPARPPSWPPRSSWRRRWARRRRSRRPRRRSGRQWRDGQVPA